MKDKFHNFINAMSIHVKATLVRHKYLKWETADSCRSVQCMIKKLTSRNNGAKDTIAPLLLHTTN